LYRPGQELRNQPHQVIDGQREDAEHQVAERAAPAGGRRAGLPGFSQGELPGRPQSAELEESCTPACHFLARAPEGEGPDSKQLLSLFSLCYLLYLSH